MFPMLSVMTNSRLLAQRSRRSGGAGWPTALIETRAELVEQVSPQARASRATVVSALTAIWRMARMCWLTLGAFLAANVARASSSMPSQELEFTFLLPAGSKECFYQTVDEGNILEFEYQVIGESNLDVSFVMISPSGWREFDDSRRGHATHKLERTDQGDYQLCFDNSFSKVKEKMLFFTLLISNPNSTAQDEGIVGNATTGQTLEYKLADFMTRVNALHVKIQRARVIQLMLRTFDTRDQRLQDNNLWRVSFGSCISVVVILGVANAQVRILESLFPES
ncbi:transmembrane emp24 domain-containing protein 1-like [Phyllopteryx taeniolatus]|uniref:transmembrane emp24 domain-containing protein 1-like n=1 Tax=Phyllopteryx taeniolatus TaxID=161469 RepID=UPI002AD2AF5C|nr:transmembrane emp24 domain-containing protein 1-like [Phyllopteryx taeniolatus]